MEFRKLTVDADFATSLFNRKEEKCFIPHLLHFSVVSCSEDSTSSIGSSSSSSLCDDDALSSFSSSSSSSSLLSQREVCEEQQLLCIKKGLSKFYEGKSRTFSSLSDVKCVDDLAKGENDYRKKYSRITPKATISKKHGRASLATLVSKMDISLRPE
ncbi:uncharacterized protein LOC111462384 [Cucurbita moschata]|uniref:Uncharacterized protein LOC111462384 n=1 Tax=Cucurbita moschata TaxID=3662 RepID=A0A6J1HB27_CUCMO|nr:uncharacterized protein LOC111462384 [Cucurbita moschata]